MGEILRILCDVATLAVLVMAFIFLKNNLYMWGNRTLIIKALTNAKSVLDIEVTKNPKYIEAYKSVYAALNNVRYL